MTDSPLADTHFFLHGEEPEVSAAIGRYFSARGAAVTQLLRLEDFNPPRDMENVLVVHYAASSGLVNRLPQIRRKFSPLRILLLHEFTDRGKIENSVIEATDHMLEKPFTRASIEKALLRFGFHPLSGKQIYFFSSESGDAEESMLKNLGAVVLRKLPEVGSPIPLELALFSPESLNGTFRDALSQFRKIYPEVPIFMLYDPQAPGVLDSAILGEIAYLLQKPLKRLALRQKILAFFEQPQKERRKNPRKHGISQVWISAFNPELGVPELFESPFLIDISQSGLSFQTHIHYNEDQPMTIWVISEDYPDKIVDLRGSIRWASPSQRLARLETGENSGTENYKYGVEFEKHDSEAYIGFARMIAMHSG